MTSTTTTPQPKPIDIRDDVFPTTAIVWFPGFVLIAIGTATGNPVLKGLALGFFVFGILAGVGLYFALKKSRQREADITAKAAAETAILEEELAKLDKARGMTVGEVEQIGDTAVPLRRNQWLPFWPLAIAFATFGFVLFRSR